MSASGRFQFDRLVLFGGGQFQDLVEAERRLGRGGSLVIGWVNVNRVQKQTRHLFDWTATGCYVIEEDGGTLGLFFLTASLSAPAFLSDDDDEDDGGGGGSGGSSVTRFFFVRRLRGWCWPSSSSSLCSASLTRSCGQEMGIKHNNHDAGPTFCLFGVVDFHSY